MAKNNSDKVRPSDTVDTQSESSLNLLLSQGSNSFLAIVLLLSLLIGIPLALSDFISGPSIYVTSGFAVVFIWIVLKNYRLASRMASSLKEESQDIHALFQDADALDYIVSDIRAKRPKHGTIESDEDPDVDHNMPRIINKLISSQRNTMFNHILGVTAERYAAIEVLNSEELGDAFRREQHMRILPIREKEAFCLGLGFLGTIIGLIVQICAVGGDLDAVVSRTFLFGSVLSLATTLQGAITAIYMMFLARYLDGMYQNLSRILFRQLRFHLLSHLGTGSEEANTIFEIRQGFEEIRKDLTQMSNEMVNNLPSALGSELRKVLMDNFNAEMSSHRDAVKISIEKVCHNLTETSQLLSSEYANIRSLQQEIISTPETFEKTISALTRAVGNFTAQFGALESHFTGMRSDIKGFDETVAGLTRDLDFESWIASLKESCDLLADSTKEMKDATKNQSITLDNLAKFVVAMADFGELAEKEKRRFMTDLKQRATKGMQQSLDEAVRKLIRSFQQNPNNGTGLVSKAGKRKKSFLKLSRSNNAKSSL